MGHIPAPAISWGDIMLHCNGGGNQGKKDLCLFLFSQMGLSINPIDSYNNYKMVWDIAASNVLPVVTGKTVVIL